MGASLWTSPAELIGHDVLEARIDEDTLRGFIESIIGRGFYTWEDEPLVSLDQTPILQSITVSSMATCGLFAAPQIGRKIALSAFWTNAAASARRRC